MVIGLGNDITECARIHQLLEKHGPLFLDHFLTAREKEESAGRLSYYAGRWAAKEAIAKALGCGIGEHCALKDLEILNNPQGKPEVTLSGAAKATADRLKAARVHISISHEKQYAVATALLESAERGE